jgi:hypothetical protein
VHAQRAVLQKCCNAQHAAREWPQRDAAACVRVQHEAQRQKWLVEMAVVLEATYRGVVLDLNDEHVRARATL